MFLPSGISIAITKSAASATGEPLCVITIVGIARSRSNLRQCTSPMSRPVNDEPKTTVPGCAAAEIIRFMPWSLDA